VALIALLSVPVFGESLTATQGVGIGLVIAGVPDPSRDVPVSIPLDLLVFHWRHVVVTVAVWSSGPG
jgi:hypothetical protein